MHGCASWTVKNAEHWRIDAFELWCWRRLLRVPWTARRPNQSILKEISPEYYLEVLPMNQSFQRIFRTDAEAELHYFGHLMGKELTHWKRLWCWERLKVEGEGDNRRWDGWMASLTEWMWVWVNSGSWWWTGWPGVLQSMGSQRVRQDCVTELNWTDAEHPVTIISGWLFWKPSGLTFLLLLSREENCLCFLLFHIVHIASLKFCKRFLWLKRKCFVSCFTNTLFY